MRAAAPIRPAGRLAAGALLALLLVGAGCAAQPAAQPPPTADPALAVIREARAALGMPSVALAEALLSLSAGVDDLRHEVPRGVGVQDAAPRVEALVAEVRSAADAAEASITAVAPSDVDASEPAGRAEVDAAVEAVSALVGQARAAADAAEAELPPLLALADLDVRMDAAVEAWGEPGSQSQRRAALAELAEHLDALAIEAAQVEAVPAGCRQPVDARPRWAALLAERSRRLGELATSAGGDEYGELLSAFEREPYGEDRRAADAAARRCWSEASPVAAAAVAAPGHVDDLEAALNP
jgi:hypothetical protein